MKKIRQRYILFEIITEKEDQIIDKKELISKIWNSITAFFGTYNTFQVGLWLIRYNPSKRVGILRCDNISKDMVIATLAFTKSVGDVDVIFHTRKTSGSIRTMLDYWKKIFPKVQIPPDERK